MKAGRNKTIDLTAEEGRAYLERCLSPDAPCSLDEVRDRTLVGDCLEFLPLLPPACADLLIADPPYNMDKRFHGSSFRHMSDEDYTDYTERWLLAALPCLKQTASVYVCCDWQSSAAVYAALKKHLIVRNRITWQREKGRGSKKNWKNGMEDIWFATRSENYVFHAEAVKQRRRVVAPYRVDGRPKDWEETERGAFRSTYASNFWDDITIPFWSMPENTQHPAQKSEKLYAKLILASSREGGMVFDPFLGSGTASVAARKLGRHFLGIEKEEQYCIWAEKRLEAALADRRIQGYEDGVFWERNSRAFPGNPKEGARQV